MHELMEYICGELEELERKASKEGKLSAAEIQYGDTLAHFKKNLLKSEEMWDDSEYSMDSYAEGGGNRGGGNRGGNRGVGSSNRSYRSYARRNSRGRYSREQGYSGEEMADELRELMEDAPDERTRQEFQRFIKKIEQMG